MCAARAVAKIMMVEAAAVELFMTNDVRFLQESSASDIYDRVAAETELDVQGYWLLRHAVKVVRITHRQQGEQLWLLTAVCLCLRPPLVTTEVAMHLPCVTL